jgi:RimJ/RimL family protein N-acetyltransferase
MRLIDVYEHPEALRILYTLMEERECFVSISYKRLPTQEEHIAFVASRPYESWEIIETDGGEAAGTIYLSRAGEIGVFILKTHRRRGLGFAAIQEMIVRHPGRRLLANVNPQNYSSIELFEQLGFRLLQQTYALETLS